MRRARAAATRGRDTLRCARYGAQAAAVSEPRSSRCRSSPRAPIKRAVLRAAESSPRSLLPLSPRSTGTSASRLPARSGSSAMLGAASGSRCGAGKPPAEAEAFPAHPRSGKRSRPAPRRAVPALPAPRFAQLPFVGRSPEQRGAARSGAPLSASGCWIKERRLVLLRHRGRHGGGARSLSFCI